MDTKNTTANQQDKSELPKKIPFILTYFNTVKSGYNSEWHLTCSHQKLKKRATKKANNIYTYTLIFIKSLWENVPLYPDSTALPPITQNFWELTTKSLLAKVPKTWSIFKIKFLSFHIKQHDNYKQKNQKSHMTSRNSNSEKTWNQHQNFIWWAQRIGSVQHCFSLKQNCTNRERELQMFWDPQSPPLQSDNFPM